MTPEFKYGKGKAKSALALGELERSVLDTIWESGEIQGKELYDKLGTKHSVRHNTILTVLERLINKGLVTKRKDGRSNSYKAKISRDEFAAQVAKPIIEELLDVSSHAAMSAFVDNASADPEKLKELKRLIARAERDRDKNNKGDKSK